MQNLFTPADAHCSEVTEVLASGESTRIERIVSRGQASPPGFWYDQPEHEWVTLLAGAARLQFESGAEIPLGPGDHLLIPAHCRHRVQWTTPDRDTVWLAVFYAAPSPELPPSASDS